MELAYRLAPDVPVGLGGDPVRLRQILVNLINNAVKFTEAGEVVLCVQLEKTEGERVTLQFTVTDTGVGIPLDKQSKIFESFTQADASTTRRFGGTGLGLAIVSQLVELMGGRVWVESQAGIGSRFHFTALFETRPNCVSKTPLAQLADLRGLPVLVVDDSHAFNVIPIIPIQPAPELPPSFRTAIEPEGSHLRRLQVTLSAAKLGARVGAWT